MGGGQGGGALAHPREETDEASQEVFLLFTANLKVLG